MFFKRLGVILILTTLIITGCTVKKTQPSDVSQTTTKQKSTSANEENTNNEKYTINQLYDTALSNDIKLVKKIIASKSIDINQTNSDGYYPIESVLPMSNCELAKILLNAGADPHVIPKNTDTNNQTIYDYVTSKNSNYSECFKNIFIEHTQYKKGK